MKKGMGILSSHIRRRQRESGVLAQNLAIQSISIFMERNWIRLARKKKLSGGTNGRQKAGKPEAGIILGWHMRKGKLFQRTAIMQHNVMKKG